MKQVVVYGNLPLREWRVRDFTRPDPIVHSVELEELYAFRPGDSAEIPPLRGVSHYLDRDGMEHYPRFVYHEERVTPAPQLPTIYQRSHNGWVTVTYSTQGGGTPGELHFSDGKFQFIAAVDADRREHEELLDKLLQQQRARDSLQISFTETYDLQDYRRLQELRQRWLGLLKEEA